MGFASVLLILIAIYFIGSAILWLLLDCNVGLWFKAKFQGTALADMRGKVVWITGASSGIGKGLALNLAKHGVKLVLSARRLELLQEVQTECLAASNGLLAQKDVLVVPMDMLNTEMHQKCFDKVLQHFQKLDILVNNAGRSQRANWEEIDVQVDRDLFELDVFSLMHLSRLVVRYFLQQNGGKGHIAVTSSVAGIVPVPFSATYCAAKHAVNAYYKALKLEQPQLDISIFAPGPIATDFLQEAFTGDVNAKVGQSTAGQKRMTADRCGYLFAVAIANRMLLSWCGLFPITFLTYVGQMPFLQNILLGLMGKKTMAKIREGTK